MLMRSLELTKQSRALVGGISYLELYLQPLKKEKEKVFVIYLIIFYNLKFE